MWASVNDQSSNNQLEIKKTKENKTTRKVQTLDEVLDEYNLSNKEKKE